MLVSALALVLVLTILIAAVQHLSAQQLSQVKMRANSQRALEMAEIGANAYLFQLGVAFVRAPLPWLPSANDVSNAPEPWPVDMATFRRRAGRHPNFRVFNYPAGVRGQGFVVGHRNDGDGVVVVSYGFCGGAVRMIRCSAVIFSPFEWAAAFGLDPYSPSNPGPAGDKGPAWNFFGNAKIVGASGAQGLIQNSINAQWFDGPLYLFGNAIGLNPNLNPVVQQSAHDLPPGHVGIGTLARPSLRRLRRALVVPTVDEAAQQYVARRWGVGNPLGARYFEKLNNDNATGIVYLVRNKDAGSPHYGKIRQLPGRPTFNNEVDPVLNLMEVASPTLVRAGMTTDEELVGVRIYPGNYFFTRIRQNTATGPRLYIRSVADGETGTDMQGQPFVVYADADYSVIAQNPNPGMSADREVRIWVAGVSLSGGGTNSASDLSDNIWMEDRTYPSRFRIMMGNPMGCRINGNGQNKFTVNLLAYNLHSVSTGPYAGTSNVPSGQVIINSNVYLYGSLVGWNVVVGGGATIERQARMEDSPYEVMAYQVTDWREID